MDLTGFSGVQIESVVIDMLGRPTTTIGELRDLKSAVEREHEATLDARSYCEEGRIDIKAHAERAALDDKLQRIGRALRDLHEFGTRTI
jgi:hypothetical protein